MIPAVFPISAGTIEEGKRDYRVRVIGQYENADQILETILAYRDGRPVHVSDVGTVELGYVKRRGFVRSLGTPSIAINAIRQTGARKSRSARCKSSHLIGTV